jgi:outer membrane protein TolC
LAGAPAADAAPSVVRVGVLFDGPWPQARQVLTVLEHEAHSLLDGEFDVRFPESAQREADFTLPGLTRDLQALLSDPSVDVVITLGPLSSTLAGRLGALPKPVIAPFILDPELQGVPQTEGGGSGVENFCYVGWTSLTEEVLLHRELVPFEHLAVLVSSVLMEGVPELAGFESRFEELGVRVTFVPVTTSASEALAAVPADADAVYVAPLRQLEAGEFVRLVDGFKDRRLPSFSFIGRREVDGGILASMVKELDGPRLARRIALNLQRILSGEEPGDIPSRFDRGRAVTINMETALAIGWSPTFELLAEAELLHEGAGPAVEVLSLERAVELAVEGNRDLLASRHGVTAGVERVREARARLFPQVGLAAVATVIDDDRAEASFGSVSERTLTGQLSVEQILYSERVRTGLDVERLLQVGREHEHESLRLDVMLQASVSYLNLLRVESFERIQKDNLKLTRSNLEVARTRRRLGLAGPTEVSRFENLLANNRQAVIDAGAQRAQVAIEVNRVLNRSLEQPFATEEFGLEDARVTELPSRLGRLLDRPESFARLRNAAVELGIEASPELKQVDAGIDALRRGLTGAQRSFYVPDISLGAAVATKDRGGAGSSPPDFGFPLPVADDTDWSVQLTFGLPLSTGGARRAAVQRTMSELDQALAMRESVAQRVEQRIRSSLHQAAASFAGIGLSQEAAAAARRNLEAVLDAYGKGLATILDLLDAQNSALIADQLAATSLFDYVIDLMRVERARGEFQFLRPQAEVEASFRELERLSQP